MLPLQGLLIAALAPALLGAAAPGPTRVVQDDAPPQEEPAQDDALPADDAVPPVEPEDPEEPAPELAPYEARYRDHAALEALVTSWIETSGGLLRPIALPPTRGGLSVPAFEWGTPGATPLAERPTLVLLGGLDGVSLAGGEAVLFATSELVRRTDDLPADLAFVAVPWASPDGLQRAFDGSLRSGANLARADRDGDEAADEDGPDDLDGDGLVLEMLIEDPAGEWTRSRDPRFLARARPGDAPRYLLVPEGADDDGDGLFNEDPPGGVVLDRNFPVDWSCEGRGGASGAWPLSEDVARALADLVRSRRSVCVVLFQGAHGALAHPGGLPTGAERAQADRATWDWAARALGEATGTAHASPLALCEARGEERPGAALDWFYEARGAAAFEVALWGPEVALGEGGRLEEASSSEALEAPFRPDDVVQNAALAPEPSAADRAWARWLDNRRGGVGFTEWSPVELGGGETALLGGWAPRTRLNPPDDELARVLIGVDRFVETLAHGMPRLQIVLEPARRDGSILHLAARVANTGELATGLASEPRPPGAPCGVRLELELPAGARILAGTERVEFGSLAGGSRSARAEWILLAPAGSVVRLRATSRWCPTVEKELRP